MANKKLKGKPGDVFGKVAEWTGSLEALDAAMQDFAHTARISGNGRTAKAPKPGRKPTNPQVWVQYLED